MKTLSLRFVVVIAFVVIAISTNTAQAEYRDTVDKSFKVRPGGTLTVESDLGSIDVRTERGNRVDIEVVRRVKGYSSREAKRILDDLDLDFYQRGDDVFVEARYDRERFGFFNWGNSRLRLEFHITVPTEYNVDLKTSGGSISVDDLEGHARAKTSGGSLKFGDIKGPVWGNTSGGGITLVGCEGEADIHTSGGSITIGDVDGDVQAKTSGGSIRIDRARGSVDAETSGGSIYVDEVMGDINASTSGGSISASLSEQPQADCRLTTSGGGITIKLADHIRANIDAKTSGGGVHTDFPVTVRGQLKKNILVAKINGGGPELYLRTSGGGISIKEM